MTLNRSILALNSKVFALGLTLMTALVGFAAEVQAGAAAEQYLQKVVKKCSRNYFPLPEWDQSKGVVRFRVSKDGAISHIEILQHQTERKHHQRLKIADDTLISTVHNLDPLPALPQSIKEPAEITIVFDALSVKPIQAKFSDVHALTDRSR